MKKPGKKSFKNLRVLIVDDNKASRDILHSVLRESQVREIQAAKDGHNALALIRNGFWPDLIIADLGMPVIDGIELTRIIRTGKNIPNHEAPVIMITSHPDKTRVRLARDAGISELMAKPFTLKTLASHMHEAIERPRPFVESTVYTGPDRRRKWDLDYDDQDRREDE